MGVSQKIEQPFVLEEWSSGLIDDLSVSDNLIPKNAVRHVINARFDRPRGAVSQRYGTTAVGSGAVAGSSAILGLHNLRTTLAAGTSRLIAVAAGAAYYLNGNTWTVTTSGLTSGVRFRFMTYLDRAVMLNGVDGAKSWDGNASWLTTGGPLDVGNWPALTKYATTLNGRAFTAGNSSFPCRLYKSSIVASDAISWTSGNGFVDVQPNDGTGSITSITNNARMILVFKDRSLFRYDDTDLQRIGHVGTPSHESVVTDDNGVTYFFGQGANSVGIYGTTGGYPKKLSRPIQKWIEAIDPAYYSSISAFTDGQTVRWNVGSVTIGDTTYTNAQLVYFISDKHWSVYSYASRFEVFAQYIVPSTSAITTVGGGTDSFVQTIDSGTTDNGTPIQGECEFAPFIFSLYPALGRKSMSSKRGEIKRVVEMMTFCKDYQGLKLVMSVDRGPWIEVGAITEKEQRFKGNFPMLRGNVFHPKIVATNSGTPWVFEGLDFYNVITEGYSS